MTRAAADGLAFISYIGILAAPVVSWSGWVQLGAGLSMTALVSMVVAWTIQTGKGNNNDSTGI